MEQRKPLTMQAIATKIHDGEPLSLDDGVFLFRNVELHQVGSLADFTRKRLHGDTVRYVVNAHLNPTNVCQVGCPLCAFGCSEDDSRAYTLELDDILRRVDQAVAFGITQLHLVSSVHPKKPYRWYRNILQAVHEKYPSLRLKAWTAVEIANFAQLSGMSVREVLLDMRSVGLSSLPGGGAEIFAPGIRQRIAPDKIAADDWLAVHRTAHELGIPTNASMLFGHFETPEHRIEHLLRLRELQDETNGFDCFIPLVFHPKNTRLNVPPISPQEILKTIAISRLMLRNIPHVKAYWVTLGESLAQIALSYGADDFDGTVFEERIHHDAGSMVPPGLPEERLCELVRGAGRSPWPEPRAPAGQR